LPVRDQCEEIAVGLDVTYDGVGLRSLIRSGVVVAVVVVAALAAVAGGAGDADARRLGHDRREVGDAP
jgi:hypothetical protein